MQRTLPLLLTMAVCAAAALPAHAQDVERGRNLFKLCEGCHSAVPGEHRYGPSLAGVFNRPAGRLKGYQFSDALSAVKFRWDAPHLTQWLSDEAKNMVPGTRMEYPGITDPQDVKALAQYLSTLKAR